MSHTHPSPVREVLHDTDEVAVHEGRPRLTRRGLLMLGGLGAAGVAGLGVAVGQLLEHTPTGTLTPEAGERPPDQSVDRSTLVRRSTVAQARFVYEVNGAATTYWVTDDFGRRLDSWAHEYVALTGAGFNRIRSYGAWVSGTGRLWHGAGRAFDLAALNTGEKVVVSARYDLWRTESSASVARRQRDYWRLAATLHLHFADVLTYLYDASHANHIHVDNGRFISGPTRFIPRSSVQTQSVQAMLYHVWGVGGMEISGEYDDATRDAAATVLARAGFDGELVDGAEAWAAFMRGTARRA